MNTGRALPRWRNARRRSTLAVIIVALLALGVAAAHCGPPPFVPHAFGKATTALVQAPGHDNVQSPCPAKPVAAALPEPADAPTLLGAMVLTPGIVVAAVAGNVAPTVRGPPGPVAPHNGQARLAHFCISRR